VGKVSPPVIYAGRQSTDGRWEILTADNPTLTPMASICGGVVAAA